MMGYFLPDLMLFRVGLIQQNQTPTLPPTNPKLTLPMFGHFHIPIRTSLFKQTFCSLPLGRVKVGTETVELNKSIICTKAKVSLSTLANKQTGNINSTAIICEVIIAEIPMSCATLLML